MARCPTATNSQALYERNPMTTWISVGSLRTVAFRGAAATFLLCCGAAIVYAPRLATFAAVGLLGVWVLRSPKARLLVVLGGGLLALQSSSQFGAVKAAYALGVLAAVIGAMLALSETSAGTTYTRLRPLLRASGVMGAVVILSLVPALTAGTSLTLWLRDAAPYMLFAAVPLLANDASHAYSRRGLTIILVITGLIASGSFAIEWIGRRGLATLPISRIAFPSFLLAAAVFAFASSASLHARRKRGWWLLLACVVFVMLILTATRSTITILAAPIYAVIVAREFRAAALARVAVLLPLVCVIVLASSQLIASLAHVNSTSLFTRLGTFTSAIQRPSQDASGAERLTESRLAWRTFESAPLLGVGAGHEFEWYVRGYPSPKYSYNLDSPVSFIAKFGLLGAAVLGLLVLRFWSFVRPKASLSLPRVAAGSFAVVVAVWSLLGPPFEDKGFSLGLILLLGILIRDERNLEDSVTTST
jgi:hypothetical protein